MNTANINPIDDDSLATKSLLVFITRALPAFLLLLVVETSQGGSATWLSNPSSGNWNTNANWTPNTGYPNGPSDVATFDVSSTTSISVSGNVEVAGIVFNSSNFTITPNLGIILTIGGTGITNNSGITQNFATSGSGSQIASILFTNNATAGSETAFVNNGGTNNGKGGITQFLDSSTAGNAIFTNNVGIASGAGGTVLFNSTSTAGNAIFTNYGATTSGGGGGNVNFFNSATAGSATFTNNGATVSDAETGATLFNDSSSADSATLIANGGTGRGGLILFSATALGGTSTIEVFDNGNLDISFRSGAITVGSIEGNGDVFLGSNNLTVGSNNLTKSFSGVIQDGGLGGGTAGSLTKTGKGKLTLSNGNTYTGGTILSRGTLLVTNKIGSGTGTGNVQVNSGTFGGTGIVTGNTTVGNGATSGATLLPGSSATKPGALTINNALTFNPLSTYKCVLNRSKARASTARALGVTINSNVTFTFVDTGSGTLTSGTAFTVINNTSANPIFGTFSNLPDGSSFTSNGTTFLVSYEGGTGNDLTLTVQ
jgi:hypothetical protein